MGSTTSWRMWVLRSSKAKVPCTRRAVTALITTALAGARAWSRAATLAFRRAPGARAARHRPSPPPRPGRWMPSRTWLDTVLCREPGIQRGDRYRLPRPVHGAPGIVFMGRGIAKIDQCFIAEILGNMALIMLDDRSDLLVGADDARKSSGSSWPESCVEPTRSQNITVSCRRSASGALCATAGVRTGTASGVCDTTLSTGRDDTPSSAEVGSGSGRSTSGRGSGGYRGIGQCHGRVAGAGYGAETACAGSASSRRAPGRPPHAPAGGSTARPGTACRHVSSTPKT